jgi:glucosamine--fructose-6-phosphate aminotransferase (isomerizing)
MSSTMATISPFERDIASQPEALRAFAQLPTPLADRLEPRGRGVYERIVLTGMGSSHFAALPSWRRLVAAGHPAWWVDTGQLLDSPELLTPGTLLVATSQSGASGEVVALLDRLGASGEAVQIVGITNDESSPLAQRADTTVLLRSGAEATVSTKSYLNTLAAQDRLTAALLGSAADDLWAAAKVIEGFSPPDVLADIAQSFATTLDARLVYVGYQDQAATALYAGLITKEAAKIPADGYVGGQFRHGPLELAGPGLTAVLFGGQEASSNESLVLLASELVASGSTVLGVGPLKVEGVVDVPVPEGDVTTQLAHGSLVAQHLAVALARARGITPGAFRYGTKITTAL